MDRLAFRVVRRYAAAMPAEVFAEAFFRKHPHLKRLAPHRVADKSSGGSATHPEARQAGEEIQLFPKFWHLPEATQEFVFAHEIGHYVLAQHGLQRLIDDLAKHGVDAWDTSSLPFGQFNMDEAFADSFATYFLDRSELKRRYPAWDAVVHEVVT